LKPKNQERRKIKRGLMSKLSFGNMKMNNMPYSIKKKKMLRLKRKRNM